MKIYLVYEYNDQDQVLVAAYKSRIEAELDASIRETPPGVSYGVEELDLQ